MCFPVQYAIDTVTLFGHVVDHDPSYQASAQEIEQTNAQWKQEYATSLQDEVNYMI